MKSSEVLLQSCLGEPPVSPSGVNVSDAPVYAGIGDRTRNETIYFDKCMDVSCYMFVVNV